MALSIPIISEFNGKGIKQAQQEFKQLEGTSQKAGFVLRKAMIPATAALGGLGAMAKDVIGIASDLGESQSKVNVIFGEGAKDVEAFSKQAAKSMGQSRRAVLQAAGTFGTFGKAAGLGGKDLAKFSNDFTKLAGDLASFNNTSPEEAVEAIGAALRGEAEPMRRFGVLLNDATLKAEAMALGIYDGSGALTDQQKILAAQSAIYKQTGDAQGDFERTSEGLANSQRILSASIDDTKASIGDALLPIVEEVIPYLKDFADWARDNPGTFTKIAGAIGAIAASTVALNIAMSVNPYVAAAAGIVAMALAFEHLYNEVSKINKIGGLAARVLGALFGGPSGKLGSMLKIEDAVRNLFGVKNSPKRGDGFTSFNVPMMADGGIVKASPGGTLALIGEGGQDEAVIPLDRMGSMGGGDVNIYVQGADPNAVVDALRTYMFRNGSVPIRVS
jgi:hypothetical protein